MICLSFTLCTGTIHGSSTSIVVLVSARKSRRSGNHTVSRYVNCDVVSSRIGVPVPAVYWFHARAICKCFFASVSGLRQCFTIVSTFANPCSCRKIRRSIPAYSLGPYTTAFDVFLLYPSFGRNILVVLFCNLSKYLALIEFTGKLYITDGRNIP